MNWRVGNFLFSFPQSEPPVSFFPPESVNVRGKQNALSRSDVDLLGVEFVFLIDGYHYWPF